MNLGQYIGEMIVWGGRKPVPARPRTPVAMPLPKIVSTEPKPQVGEITTALVEAINSASRPLYGVEVMEEAGVPTHRHKYAFFLLDRLTQEQRITRIGEYGSYQYEKRTATGS